MKTHKIGTRQQIEGFLIEKGGLGWYVLDWDYESTRTVAGPYKRRTQAVNKAIDLSYPGYV